MLKPRLTLTVLAVAAALTLTACSGPGDTAGGEADRLQTVSAGTLTVCSDVPYAPFEDFDESSELGYTGFDIEVMAAVAEQLDLELAVKDQGFDGIQSGIVLNSKQCDIAASAITITEEREANLDFTEPYYDSMQSLLVAADSDIASIDDLDGVKVGVQKATTGESYAQENATGAEIVSFPSDAEMWPAIQAGQVDALLQDLPVNLEHTAEGDYEIVEQYDTGEQYGFAVSKGNAALLDAVNGALEEIRADGSYDAIYDSYFAVD